MRDAAMNIYLDLADNGPKEEHEKKSVVDVTVEYLMNKVSSRQWKPGTRIPTEFELMETLNVSRNSVREAIKILEALGLLEIRRADGTYIASRFSESMLAPWACSLLLEDDDSCDLMELRMVIERGIFSLAIQKGTEADMRAIYEASEEFVGKAQDTTVTSAVILNADIRYRKIICEATHNHLTCRLNDMIAYASMNSRKRSIDEAILCNDRFHMVDSHRKLTEIIVNRRPAELDSVLNYCFKYWGLALQQED